MNSFLGMAPVDFAAPLNQPSLPGSDKALEKLDRHFIFSKILKKQRATREAFLKDIIHYPVVQLFTHASADTSDRMNPSPALYFADSALGIPELEIPFRNATELLVLSACETGTGADQRGEGIFSLARGFAGAGIPSTLTTLWKVENQAVYEITQSFYDGLNKGLPLDEALRAAQLKWLDTGEQSDQLPYVWAGNVLIGNTSAVYTGLKPRDLGIALGVLLLVFGVLYLRSKSGKTAKHMPDLR